MSRKWSSLSSVISSTGSASMTALSFIEQRKALVVISPVKDAKDIVKIMPVTTVWHRTGKTSTRIAGRESSSASLGPAFFRAMGKTVLVIDDGVGGTYN